MATLSGNKVKDTYGSLLKLSTNGATATIKSVEDGAGVDTALKLSTDTVEVNSLKFTAAPTTAAAELTGLFIDGNNNVVKRELDSSAFTAASAQFFANPMFILRPISSYSLTATPTTPSMAGVNNNSKTSSHFVNDPTAVHLQTSATTTGAITVESAGLVKIDVNFMLEVTTSNTDVIIDIVTKPSGGSANTLQSITRSKASSGSMAIGFALVYYADTDEDIYYQVSMNASGGAALLTASTFILTKLD